MSKDAYPLTRGPSQLLRVNIQQFIWRETLGYAIHPKILPEASSVADVATATGVWLCELTNTPLNTHTLDGYDISSASFIPSRDLPRPVTLAISDASLPVAPHLAGKYDVVHVRLVQSVVNENNPAKIIEHCKGLLRPGGYLQWEEYDPLSLEVHVADDIERPSKLEQLKEFLLANAPSQWIADLPDTARKHGMVPVAVERKREAHWHRSTMTGLFFLIFEEYASTVLDNQAHKGAADALRGLLKAAWEEMMQGSYASHLFQVLVCQKAE